MNRIRLAGIILLLLMCGSARRSFGDSKDTTEDILRKMHIARTVDSLFENIEKVNFGNVKPGGDTVLTVAVKKGHADIVEALLQTGADPTIKNENGESPLSLSEKQNNPTISALFRSFMQQTAKM